VVRVQEIMKAVMRDGEHYGTIPGCGDKPTLLQPGAEKLALTFHLAPSFEIERIDLPEGHREYIVTTNIVSAVTGVFLGQGVGSCSTMESKYRWRNSADYEELPDPIPEDYQSKKQEYRRSGFGAKKIDGVWTWVKYGDTAKTPNPDIADTYNTVLKMAKKRSLIDGIKAALGVSDIFTQDAEDLLSGEVVVPVEVEPPVDAETLKDVRALRKSLGINDDLYEKQLHWAQGRAITSDGMLTANAGVKLLAALEEKLRAKREAEATQAAPAPAEVKEEIPFHHIPRGTLMMRREAHYDPQVTVRPCW
jgi:hypothetical protein